MYDSPDHDSPLGHAPFAPSAVANREKALTAAEAMSAVAHAAAFALDLKEAAAKAKMPLTSG